MIIKFLSNFDPSRPNIIHVTHFTTQVDRCFERVSEGGGVTRWGESYTVTGLAVCCLSPGLSHSSSDPSLPFQGSVRDNVRSLPGLPGPQGQGLSHVWTSASTQVEDRDQREEGVRGQEEEAGAGVGEGSYFQFNFASTPSLCQPSLVFQVQNFSFFRTF